LTIELIYYGDEWVGSTDELEPGLYQYNLVYQLYAYGLGSENVTIEKEGKEPMYLTIQ
jgi:hypothetical protein